MRDDYLWDRSGEPDAEIERLERTLGQLRLRPKPLELPAALPPRRRVFPALAAAAAVVLMLSAAGTWLALRRSSETPGRLAVVRPAQDSTAGLYDKAESFDPNMRAGEAGSQSSDAGRTQTQRATIARRAINESRAASFVNVRARRERRDERMMREGELATEKLMLALRYASSKLNLVQRRIQVNKANGPAS
jgi:hypothetical protein